MSVTSLSLRMAPPNMVDSDAPLAVYGAAYDNMDATAPLQQRVPSLPTPLAGKRGISAPPSCSLLPSRATSLRRSVDSLPLPLC